MVLIKNKTTLGSLGLTYTYYYIEWRNNRVLLYITENYIQYPMINHNGKEYKKRMYICITESLCCTAEMNTAL